MGVRLCLESSARESRIPACHHSVLLEVCSQNRVWGPGALEHIPLGLAVLKQPLLVLFLSSALTVLALGTWVRGYKSVNECRSPERFRVLG